MIRQKTIAIFGAGTGLGASLASHFGRKGYRVALIARNHHALEARVEELSSAGIEAAAFPADLTDLEGIPSLIRRIESRFETIDLAVYAPIPSGVGFVPAVSLRADILQSMAPLLTFAPVEVAHAVLPGMMNRGDGAIVVVGGLTAKIAIPGLSGVGPLMAAIRNYIFTLNAEIGSKGVFAGTVTIGAMIDRSAGLRAATANGKTLDPSFTIIDPDAIAEEIWSLITNRDQIEIVIPSQLNS